jgi:superfamily I DNA/RNA helicase
MQYCYFITSEVWNELERQRLDADTKRRLQSLENSNTKNSSFTDITDILAKSDGPNARRFVWFRELRKGISQGKEEEICMYILRKVYPHDVYEKELNEGTKQFWPALHPLSPSEDNEKENKFAGLFMAESEGKCPLPSNYRDYEDKRVFEIGRDTIYYELPLWCTGIRKVPYDYWPSIQTMLSEINEKGFEKCREDSRFRYIQVGKFTLTYRSDNENGGEDVYLLQIKEGNEPDWSELSERKYDCEDVRNLKSFSAKCYPDYFSYDYDFWKGIEEDELANLALSEEEVDVLQNVKFPFFVSGLAGSGKSTVLYYLFSHIFKYEAIKHPEHQLLFLSYNDMLVNKARMTVESILSRHKSNQTFPAKKYFEDTDLKFHYDESFKSFRTFLTANFLDSDELDRFNEKRRHITYEKFQELYNKQYRNEDRMSPSILWSVIRTFIKGRSLDYMKPSDYDNMVRRDMTVDKEDFNRAYSIWNTWYRHLYEDGKGKYWDDLDLVRYVLKKGDPQKKVFHKFNVIFCDEAQDFTKLEIDLILKLSKHSAYKLPNPEDRKIPIAFAGDPNQTISPTGFRWAGTKSTFMDSFKDSLDVYLKLDEMELSKNYRSQLGIVKFANTIQCFRYKYLDTTTKRRNLQSVREDLKGEPHDALNYVGFYSYNQHKSIILENLANANIIMSGDGNEGDRSLFPEITDEIVKLNTAIGTKGLEYNAVMLLNFCDNKINKLFKKILDETHLEDSENFEIAHFFTKLYIAVTRAREQLFIVDTDENYQNFWKYFTEHELWEKLIARFSLSEENRRLVGHITQGDINSLPDRLNETYNPEENARQAFERAKGESSILLMKRAESYFLEAKLPKKAEECEAYALLYDFNYLDAGDKFLNIGDFKMALDAYWIGNYWEKVISTLPLCKDCSSPYNQIRKYVSQFMSGTQSGCELLGNLVTPDTDAYQDADCCHPEDRVIWKSVFDKLSTELLTSAQIPPILIRNLNNLSPFVSWYDKGFSSLRASLYYAKAECFNEDKHPRSKDFKKDDYESAVSIWEKFKLTENNRKYFRAKKLIAEDAGDDSEEIKWMDRLNEKDDIVKKYGSDETASSLNDEAKRIVFTSLLSRNYEKAITYPYPVDDETKYDRLFDFDKNKFLINVILQDFRFKKYKYIKNKIEKRGKVVFDSLTPVEVFDGIFRLQGSWKKEDLKGIPYWIGFISKLRIGGSRVFKKIDDRSNLLESLAKAIKAIKDAPQKETALSACFLEFLFDDQYDPEVADKFKDTLVEIFGNRKQLCKYDFRSNIYFTKWTKLTSEQLSSIRNHIYEYTSDYINNVSAEVVANEETKAMLRACELCCWTDRSDLGQDVTEGQDETMGQNETTGQDVTEGQDETEDQDETMDQDETPGRNVKPDYPGICDMYERLNDERKIIGIPTWLQSRFLINQFMLDGLNGRASFTELQKSLEEKEIKLEDFINDFSKDDAYMFVAALNSNKDQTSEPVLCSDTLTNKFNLDKNVLNFYCSIDTLTKALPSAMEPVVTKALIVLAQKEPEIPSTPPAPPIVKPPMSNEKKMQLEMARNMKKNEGFPDDVILRLCNLLTADDIAKL